MTRPKADSDPWLTDMVTRDREVAKTVVYGFRTIISLLRGIRDETAANQTAMQREIRELRQEVIDLYSEVRKGQPVKRSPSFVGCPKPECSLPDGHPGNHRAFIRRANVAWNLDEYE